MRKFDNKEVGLSKKELAILKRLNTPRKVQDYVSALPQNFELMGETSMSVRETLAKHRAHCIEGAILAALAFWVNGKRPLLMDLKTEGDDDHVVAIFKEHGHWGAISKTNHAVLRYRDPIYRSLRELAMSYIHEYSDKRWKISLRSYSRLLDLSMYRPEAWITGKEAWVIAKDIDAIKHFPLMTRAQAKKLRKLEVVEQKAGSILQYKRR
ncbi:MAG: hypothetical protein A3D65_05325 [Candidatus Lloydbacteria bacterium RIFCSPHIGHO2_02_FULL_50_13]|uniref:Transglutaminase-like domain-containing protein n=1 Tax=Candidatus Lloydbacteria bacterium RIFCSPHIGHO2_02_FULL_50_13 TaxID=1798661 RepID=A0A1G2D7X9_9BACT|nr:MAG: hypothetical protein A3D65_05325 [Candidatus Lloydbacteria bacterium RIFCSPHIGHO2_02_FULL_50_13]